MAVTATASDTTALAVVFVWSCLCRVSWSGGRCARARARTTILNTTKRRGHAADRMRAVPLPQRVRDRRARRSRRWRRRGRLGHVRARAFAAVAAVAPHPGTVLASTAHRATLSPSDVRWPASAAPRPSSRPPLSLQLQTFTDHEPTTRRPSDGGGGRAVRRRRGCGLTTRVWPGRMCSRTGCRPLSSLALTRWSRHTTPRVRRENDARASRRGSFSRARGVAGGEI